MVRPHSTTRRKASVAVSKSVEPDASLTASASSMSLHSSPSPSYLQRNHAHAMSSPALRSARLSPAQASDQPEWNSHRRRGDIVREGINGAPVLALNRCSACAQRRLAIQAAHEAQQSAAESLSSDPTPSVPSRSPPSSTSHQSPPFRNMPHNAKIRIPGISNFPSLHSTTSPHSKSASTLPKPFSAMRRTNTEPSDGFVESVAAVVQPLPWFDTADAEATAADEGTDEEPFEEDSADEQEQSSGRNRYYCAVHGWIELSEQSASASNIVVPEQQPSEDTALTSLLTPSSENQKLRDQAIEQRMRNELLADHVNSLRTELEVSNAAVLYWKQQASDAISQEQLDDESSVDVHASCKMVIEQLRLQLQQQQQSMSILSTFQSQLNETRAQLQLRSPSRSAFVHRHDFGAGGVTCNKCTLTRDELRQRASDGSSILCEIPDPAHHTDRRDHDDLSASLQKMNRFVEQLQLDVEKDPDFEP